MAKDKWFSSEVITNYEDWERAYRLQDASERAEREWIGDFLPAFMKILGIGLFAVFIFLMLLPPKKAAS